MLSRFTRLFIAASLLLLLLACTNTNPTNDSGEIEAKVEATLTAVAGINTPTPPIQSGPSVGFTRLEIGNNRTVDIPENWTPLKLDQETLSGLAESAASELAPEFQSFFPDAAALSDFFQQGMLLTAIDSEHTTFEFSPNVNILTEELPFRMSTENYMLLNAGSIPQVGGVIIENSLLQLNGSDVGVIVSNYETQFGIYETIQYVWTERDIGWVITMSFIEDHDYPAITESIARSLR